MLRFWYAIVLEFSESVVMHNLLVRLVNIWHFVNQTREGMADQDSERWWGAAFQMAS